MGHMQDIREAVAGAPTEASMQAALRIADQARADAEFWRRACDVHIAQAAAVKGLADRQAKELAELTVAVANLKASNIKLRQALQSDLIDHALNFEASTLVLCTHRLNARGEWVTLPVVDIEHARKVMAEDLAKDWGDDDQCTVCNGTGEGQHEGAACAACGGRV